VKSRQRKFLGGIAIVAFLALYTAAAVAVAERLPAVGWMQLLYFAVAGTAWGAPLIPLLSWMHRADEAEPR
jgi:hypothetical protein